MQITVPRIIQSIANQYTNAFTLREVKFIYIYNLPCQIVYPVVQEL